MTSTSSGVEVYTAATLQYHQHYFLISQATRQSYPEYVVPKSTPTTSRSAPVAAFCAGAPPPAASVGEVKAP